MLDPTTLASVRDFARSHLDGASDRDPAGLHAAFHAAGLSNWWLPGWVGGTGLGLLAGVDLVAELAYADAGFAFSALVSVIGGTLLELYGTAELSTGVLRRLAETGGRIATLGSEHECGSELGRMSTRLRTEAGSLVLEGAKAFSTNADSADFLLVFAATDRAEQPHAAVLVPAGSPGVTIGPPWHTLGVRSSPVVPVGFAGCPVPAGSILDGHGLRLLEIGLNASRVLIAATAIGLARRIRDLCIEHARSRTVGGRPLSRNPVFAGKLAQMELGIASMLALCRSAAAEYDQLMAGPDPAGAWLVQGTLKSAVTAKLAAGQLGWQIASTGSELFGGLGYTDAVPIGSLLQDMRYVAVVEGGEDVLRQLLYDRYVLPVARRC